MSDDDLLRRAARSLRDEAGEVTPREVASTRGRVMATLTGAKRRRNPALLFVPIAAVLAGALAFAKNGEVVRRAWGWLSGDESHDGQVTPRVEPARPFSPQGGSSIDAPARPEPESSLAPPEQPATSEGPTSPGPLVVLPHAANPPTPHTPPSTARSGSSAAAAPVASDETEEAALTLYRTAHRLHFVDRDYASALGAWDDYLRAMPQGRLAVEARYNRALALARLGRDDEARAALTPFALGQVEGGYRQREASALIGALDSRDP